MVPHRQLWKTKQFLKATNSTISHEQAHNIPMTPFCPYRIPKVVNPKYFNIKAKFKIKYIKQLKHVITHDTKTSSGHMLNRQSPPKDRRQQYRDTFPREDVSKF